MMTEQSVLLCLQNRRLSASCAKTCSQQGRFRRTVELIVVLHIGSTLAADNNNNGLQVFQLIVLARYLLGVSEP